MKTFISVAQMKLAHLVAGQQVETAGYYAPGDGGQAKYLIKATEAVDGFGNHELAGTTVAILQSINPISAKQFGAKFDDSADDTAEIEAAITVAVETVGDATGATIKLPTGTAIASSQITLPNRVSFKGANVRGSVIKADAAHSGSYMFNAVNGVVSMFGSKLENMHIDCNEVAGLGGILSDAWQENSGIRGCVINLFKTYGIYFQNGYGGASSCKIEDGEIFASSTSAAIAGIYVEEISVVGAFKLTISNTTVAGGLNGRLPNGIRFESDSSLCTNVHFEDCESGFYFDGPGHHTLITCDGSSARDGVDNLVELAATFTGTLTMINCRRNGATNFLKDNRTDGLGTITSYDEPVLVIGNPVQETALRAKNTAKAWCAFNGIGLDTFVDGDVTIGTDRVTLASHPFTSGHVVTLTTSGVLPAGLALATTYYIKVIDTNTIEFYSDEARTSIVDITAAAGGGIHTITASSLAPTESFNVSSVTKTGTGDYRIILSKNMVNSNCAPFVSCNLETNGTHVSVNKVGVGSFDVKIFVAGVATDASQVSAIAFGL